MEDAFAFYETLPEVGYALSTIAERVAQCAPLRPMWLDEHGNLVPTTDERALRVARALRAPRGGQRELLRMGALLLKICGEAWLLASTEQGAAYWEFLSPIELDVPEDPKSRAGVKRNRTGKHGEVEVSDGYFARCWVSDPRRSDRADCALRRCLDVCRELMMLSRMIEAIIVTRIPAGILAVPDGMSWQSPLAIRDETATGTDGTDNVETVEEEDDDFADVLELHLSAPRDDLSSAATLVPLIITGTPDDIKGIRLIELAKDLDFYSSNLREELLTRLGRGLDLPPEMISGKSDMSHWGANEVGHDFVRHVVPTGDVLADFLTNVHQQLLELEEGMPVDEAERHFLVFDPAPISRRADEAATSMRLWESDAISDEAMLRKQGLDPAEVMMDDGERERRLLTRLLINSRPTLTDQALRKLGLEPGDVTYTAGHATNPEGGVNPADPRDRGDVVDSESGSEAPQQREQRLRSADALLAERLLVRSGAAMDRALERSGNKILSKTAVGSELKRQCRGVSPKLIPSRVTPSDLAELGLQISVLLQGEWEGLQQDARTWLRSWLVSQGSDDRNADEVAGWATNELVSRIHNFTSVNFHVEVPYGEHGHRIPDTTVLQVIDDARERASKIRTGTRL